MIAWISFFTMVVFSLAAAVFIIKFRKITFVDVMVAVMASFMSLAFDMIFCKQLKTYHYVDINYSGITSLIAGLTIFPLISMVYTTFLPNNRQNVILYIFIWTIGLTVFELLLKPLEIVFYPKWKIIPWSVLLYLIVFPLLYYYRKIVERHVK